MSKKNKVNNDESTDGMEGDYNYIEDDIGDNPPEDVKPEDTDKPDTVDQSQIMIKAFLDTSGIHKYTQAALMVQYAGKSMTSSEWAAELKNFLVKEM